jgi:conjugal transfer mating pair stabilization protein TraG
MEWTVYCYYNVEMLQGIFSAVSRIVYSDGSWTNIVRAVVMLGFISALVVGLFNVGRGVPVLGWFMGFVLLYSVMLIPAKVAFNDQTAPLGAAAVNFQPVDNVPLGLAFFASVTSSIGNALTTTMEQQLYVPPTDGPRDGMGAVFRFQHNGLGFGNKLVARTRAATISDPVLKGDLSAFFHSCTAYDLAVGANPPATGHRGIDPNAFAHGNMWALMHGTNPGRFVAYQGDARTMRPASGAIFTCDAAWTDLDRRLVPAARTMAIQLYRDIISGEDSATLPAADQNLATEDTAATQANASMDEVYRGYRIDRIGTAGMKAGDLLRQNALINVMRDAHAQGGSRVNDTAAVMMSYAQAHMTSTTNMTYMLQAKLAEEALPMIRNAVQGILYMVFPFLFLLCLTMSPGRLATILGGYILALVWVELWPPLYAIVNYFSNLHTAQVMAGRFNATGVTLQTAGEIYGTALSQMSVVGYMAVAVPVIASGLVWGMNSAASTLGGGQFLQGGGGKMVAETAVAGNTTAGGMSVNQQNRGTSIGSVDRAEYRNIHGTQIVDQSGGFGRTFEEMTGGGRAVTTKLDQATMSTSATIDQSTVHSANRKFEEAADSVRTQTHTAQSAVEAAWTAKDAVTNGRGYQRGGGRGQQVADTGGHGVGGGGETSNADSANLGTGRHTTGGRGSTSTETVGGHGGISKGFKLGPVSLNVGLDFNHEESNSAGTRQEHSRDAAVQRDTHRADSMQEQVQQLMAYMNSDDYKNQKHRSGRDDHAFENAVKDAAQEVDSLQNAVSNEQKYAREASIMNSLTHEARTELTTAVAYELGRQPGMLDRMAELERTGRRGEAHELYMSVVDGVLAHGGIGTDGHFVAGDIHTSPTASAGLRGHLAEEVDRAIAEGLPAPGPAPKTVAQVQAEGRAGLTREQLLYDQEEAQGGDPRSVEQIQEDVQREAARRQEEDGKALDKQRERVLGGNRRREVAASAGAQPVPDAPVAPPVGQPHRGRH